MSDNDPSARPRQLTVAGGFVIAASVIMVFAVFDAITNLHSVETREQVAKALSSPTGEGLGISVAQALSGMRVGLMIAAVCAAASAVLGVFVLQRHRGARVALSVLAVPILITAPLTGGLLGAVVAVATVMLWTGPARDWFAGRAVRQPVTRDRGASDRPTDEPDRDPVPPPANPDPEPRRTSAASRPSVDLSTEQPSSQPPATSGFGQAPVPLGAPQPPQGWPPPTGAVAWEGEPPTAVPAPVKLACVLTWVFSGVVALVYAVLIVALVVAHDNLVDLVVKSPEWQRANLESDLILPVLWAGCLIFFAWSAGALVLAWFTWRRHNWARYLLAASAGAALVAGLFAFPVGLLHQVACALAITGLFSARSRAWFGGGGRSYGPPPGPPYGPPPPGQQGPPPHDPQGKPPVW